MLRNWWILGCETVLLACIGAVLAGHLGHVRFLGVLFLLLLPFFFYCLVYLLVVLRMTAKLFDTLAAKGGIPNA